MNLKLNLVSFLIVAEVIIMSISKDAQSQNEVVVTPASNEDPEGKIGERPYEMKGRKEKRKPLVDFEDLTGWEVAGYNGCTAKLFRSREELMWGEYTAKLVYKGKTAASFFEIRPKKPIPIPGHFTGVNLWVRGNNWGWYAVPQTARTNIYVRIRDAKGEIHSISLGQVNFDYWFLMHRTIISPTGEGHYYASSGGDGVIDFPAEFLAIRVTNCSDEREARLFFDSLCLYEIEYKPLKFQKPPEKEPWPTTPETITPVPKERVRNNLTREGNRYIFEAIAEHDKLRWIYEPRTGTLSDIRTELNGKLFQTNADGGIVFELAGKTITPEDLNAEADAPSAKKVKAELLDQRQIDDRVETKWRLTSGDESVEYTLTLRAKEKSLQISAEAHGGRAKEFRIGHTSNTPNAKLVSVPYLTLGGLGPYIVYSDGIFISGLMDWYNSDASQLFEAGGLPRSDEAIYNGGSRYIHKTDGKRNDLRERLIVTVASNFHEVLPNLPHPKSDMGEIAKNHLWRNIGFMAPEMLKKYKAHGIDGFMVCHHEVIWRDAGESFTLRLTTAPKNVGDERLKEYSKLVRGLGYRFGLYTNYTDYAPVNKYWDEDAVALLPDGDWQRAWPRCYAPKPALAWEREAYFAPRINKKFNTTAGYCDVHTILQPWSRTDYDARVPGAGMFRSVWESYARLLWNESIAHKGPVFSEGGMHWMYAGIADGSYAQLRGPEKWKRPALVDFDLLKMHPLMTDFGMGMPSMFYDRHGDWTTDRTRLSPWFDRFIASTIAYGHIGFMTAEWGFDGTLKSYYLLQTLQKRYAMVPVSTIRYNDRGKLVDTSRAIATDAYRDSQVAVKYQNGLEVYVNLSFKNDWEVVAGGRRYLLPPTGFVAYRENDILEYSAIIDGKRIEYVESPEYFYVDTRGELRRIGPLTVHGAVALKRGDTANEWWAIPCLEAPDLTVDPTGIGMDKDTLLTVTPYTEADEAMEPVHVRVSRSGQSFLPVKGAIKYRITPSTEPAPPLTVTIVTNTDKAVGGTTYPVKIIVSNRSQNVLSNATIVLEKIDDSGKVETSTRIDIGSAGQPGRIEAGMSVEKASQIVISPGIEGGRRLWYRATLKGTLDGKPAETEGWLDLISARAVEMEIRPVSSRPAKPGSKQKFIVHLQNNLPGESDVKISLKSEGLKITDGEKSLRLKESEKRNLEFNYIMPKEEAVEELTLMAKFPQGEITLTRWLRALEGEAVVAELNKTSGIYYGMAFRGKKEDVLNNRTGALFFPSNETVGGVKKPGFFVHPPYKGGVGYSFAEIPLEIPEDDCVLSFEIGFRDGSTTQDGVLFRIQITGEDGKTRTLWEEQYAKLKEWKHVEVSLNEYLGQRVRVRLVCDVGPADNSYSDWACWAGPRMILKGKRFVPEIHTKRPRLPIEPPRIFLRGLRKEDLANIAEAKLILDGAGVNADETYKSDIYLNDVFIGNTPGSTSDTSWSENQAVEIHEQARKTIGVRNVVIIRNPRHDCMKVRNIHLWFKLADGREGTSKVVTGPFTSAAGWKYEEGISVPNGRDLPKMILEIPVGD